MAKYLPPQGYPNRAQLVKNLVKSIGEAARAPRLSSKAEKERRMGICATCDHYDNVRQRCKKCGCVLTAKAAVKGSRCPVGKW